jgi:hypothetical protein
MEKDFVKFLAGMATGIVVGKAISKHMESEEGRRKKEKIKKLMSDFYSFIGPKIKELKNMNRSNYERIVTSAAEEYGRMKKLSNETVKKMIGQTMVLWESFLENKVNIA